MEILSAHFGRHGALVFGNRDLVESGTQTLGQFARLIIGPEVHEEQPRLFVQHVTVNGGHLDSVFMQ